MQMRIRMQRRLDSGRKRRMRMRHPQVKRRIYRGAQRLHCLETAMTSSIVIARRLGTALVGRASRQAREADSHEVASRQGRSVLFFAWFPFPLAKQACQGSVRVAVGGGMDGCRSSQGPGRPGRPERQGEQRRREPGFWEDEPNLRSEVGDWGREALLDVFDLWTCWTGCWLVRQE